MWFLNTILNIIMFLAIAGIGLSLYDINFSKFLDTTLYTIIVILVITAIKYSKSENVIAEEMQKEKRDI